MRPEVQHAILSGDIALALELLATTPPFESLLARDPGLAARLRCQRFVELIAQRSG